MFFGAVSVAAAAVVLIAVAAVVVILRSRRAKTPSAAARSVSALDVDDSVTLPSTSVLDTDEV